jgi:uncharacterized protein YbjT (DUF2867 family)
MKILIFGASGRTGRCVVRYAGGHELVLFEGDVLHAELVDAAMVGVQAVISVLGHVKGSARDMQTHGMENIAASMKRRGVRRIVSLTGTGVRRPDDKITFIDRLLNIGVGVFDPARVQDGKMHAAVLESSGLDYTILRVLKLTNGGPKNNWQLTEHGPTLPLTSREDVARAIIEIIDSDSFVGKMPMLSSK